MPKNAIRVDKTTGKLTLTVPSSAKSGILMLCASGWNANKITFSEPTGNGAASVVKIHDAYANDGGVTAHANIHIVIYIVSLKSGGTITVDNGAETDQYSDKSMVLLY